MEDRLLIYLDSTTNKRSSPSSSQQHSPTNGGNEPFKKRSSPPLTTNKRSSPRQSPSKSQQNSPGSQNTGFNVKPVVEPLEIRIEPTGNKKKSPSPSSNKTLNNNHGLLTSETDQRRSSTGVSKLIHTFQGNGTGHDLEQTILVPRLRSPVAETVSVISSFDHYSVRYSSSA